MAAASFADAMAELRDFVDIDPLLHFVVLDGYPLTLDLHHDRVEVGVKLNGHTHRGLPVGATATFGSLSPRCPFRSMRVVAEVTRHTRERGRTPSAAVVAADQGKDQLPLLIPAYTEVVISMRPVRMELSRFVATTANTLTWRAHNTNVHRTISLGHKNGIWKRRIHLTPSPCCDKERERAFLFGCSLPGSLIPSAFSDTMG